MIIRRLAGAKLSGVQTMCLEASAPYFFTSMDNYFPSPSTFSLPRSVSFSHYFRSAIPSNFPHYLNFLSQNIDHSLPSLFIFIFFSLNLVLFYESEMLDKKKSHLRDSEPPAPTLVRDNEIIPIPR